jgi:hypothetical protein
MISGRLASLLAARAWGILVFGLLRLQKFNECFLYGSLIMQIDFELAADTAKVDAEAKDQQTDPGAENEMVVAGNDNGLRWPLIPFPEGWYASF